jgi:hypothetical protein
LCIWAACITFGSNFNEMSIGIIVIFMYMLLGFWMLVFLSLWIPLMATLLFMERFSPAMGEKLAAFIAPRD